MMITGGLMVLAGTLILVLAEDSSPLWLIISGGGVLFLGTGSALRRQ